MAQTIGELIRERRLGLGLSLGQLATKAGTSASVVRTWERGDAYPDDDAAAVLGELLEISAEEFVPPPPPAASPAPEEPGTAPGAEGRAPSGEILPPETPREEPAVALQDDERDPSDPMVAAGDDATGQQVELALDSGDGVESADEADIDVDQAGAGVPDVAVDPADPGAPVDPAGVPAAPSAGDTRLPAAADPVRPVPLRFPQSAPTGVAVEVAETEPNVWNPLRYLYDPDRPWLYWIRAALTVIVLLILFNILFGSIGELFNKIGELFDTIDFDGGGTTTTTTVET